MRVVRVDHIVVYVYEEQFEPHHRPHCNVWWSGLSANIAIDKNEPEHLDGPKRIPKRVWAVVRLHYAQIRRAWNELNPERPVK